MKDLWLHPIRTFAVICVAAIAIYLAYINNKLINLLASPDWCSKALQAERMSNQNFGGGLTACTELLKLQLKASATNSHIALGVLAGCLLVLIVIVVAGGKVSFQVTEKGAMGNIGKDDVPEVKIVNLPTDPVPVAEKPPPPTSIPVTPVTGTASNVPPMFRPDA